MLFANRYGRKRMAANEAFEKCLTGIDSLDYGWGRVTAVIEIICDCLERAEGEEIAGCFGRLYSEASAQFALEEELMRSKAFPDYQSHKQEHEDLLERLRDIMDASEDGSCACCGTALRTCLNAWIADHAAGPDAALAAYSR